MDNLAGAGGEKEYCYTSSGILAFARFKTNFSDRVETAFDIREGVVKESDVALPVT